MQNLASYTASIERELTSIGFPSQPEQLYDPLKYILTLGGKRIRPILTLLGAKLFGSEPQSAMNQALAVELFHNFTLIHDDIMDNAPLRRNQSTVHEKWNTNVAILSGDALFVTAYQHLIKQDAKLLPDTMGLFNRTALEVCEGQQMDMDFEDRNDVTIEEYIEMIRLKTSVLLGCALELGAIVAEAESPDRKHLYNFGQHIGIAFQIQDDLLDLYADPDKFGKQVGGDVIANKKTILYLTALKHATAPQKEVLKQLQNETDLVLKVNRTRELFDQLEVKERCQQRMEEHYSIAKNSLAQITTSNDSKKSLIELGDFLMNRDI